LDALVDLGEIFELGLPSDDKPDTSNILYNKLVIQEP
jgi:hypothetical protein